MSDRLNNTMVPAKWLAVLASVLLFCLSQSTEARPYSIEELRQMWHSPRESARQIVDQMSLQEQIGQLVMLRLVYWPDGPELQPQKVTMLAPTLGQQISQNHIGGIVLFSENFQTIAQTYQLISSLQAVADPLPLLIATDHEGGRVIRIPYLTEMPGNMSLGATRDPYLARLAGEIHGKELGALGINMNLAPVVDVNSNQRNPVIGTRSYSSEPQLVSAMARAYSDGLHKSALLACAKHFPGHGDTRVDSHADLPVLSVDYHTWRARDLPPFQTAIADHVDAIMAAHIIFPAIDDRTRSQLTGEKVGIPATMSEKELTSLLRHKEGYQGLIITDALNMGAVNNFFLVRWRP